jgi:hypothetical protein
LQRCHAHYSNPHDPLPKGAAKALTVDGDEAAAELRVLAIGATILM